MLEMPEQLIGGAKLLAQAFGVTVHIGIEDNKMDAVEVLRNEIAKEGVSNIVVDVQHTRYPQGAEKQMIQAVTGRQVPGGQAARGCGMRRIQCGYYRCHLSRGHHRHAPDPPYRYGDGLGYQRAEKPGGPCGYAAQVRV